jgi:hypothetical protein
LEVVSIKVDKRLREKMRRLAHINWSAAIRKAIERTVAEEELRDRHVDRRDIEEAMRLTDALRRPAPGWSSTEEIRKWRDRRTSS